MRKPEVRGAGGPPRAPEARGGDAPPPASFEAGLERLEDIVRRLEGGDLPLEDSLGLFEEGTRITRELHATLDRAEKTIERLVEGASGAIRIEPFAPEGD